jgi:hypothetical protein
MSNIKNWKEFLKDIPTEVLMAEVESRKEEKISSITSNIDPIAKEIMDDIDYALTQFGEYTFGDKGPDEVMNISEITDKLRILPVNRIASILSSVLDNYNDVSKAMTKTKYRYAKSTVDTIICDLDDMPEEDFDKLFELDNRFVY